MLWKGSSCDSRGYLCIYIEGRSVQYVKIIHITADARPKTHRRTYVDQCRALERVGSFGRRFGGGPSTCSWTCLRWIMKWRGDARNYSSWEGQKISCARAGVNMRLWSNTSRISSGLLIFNIMKGAAFKTSHIDFLQIRGRVSQMKAPSLWELKELLHKLFQACDSPCWGYYGKEYSTNLGAQLQLDLNRH